MDGDYSPEAGVRSTYLAAQLKAIEEARAAGTKPVSIVGPPYPHPLPTATQTSSDSHQARIHR